jgi:uncharacterized protein involved in tellurium resistance
VVGQIGDNSTKNADGVDTDVIVKTIIFGGNKGVLQILGHLVDVDRQAVLIGMQGRDQTAVAVEYLRGNGRTHIVAYWRQCLIGSKDVAKTKAGHDDDK